MRTGTISVAELRKKCSAPARNMFDWTIRDAYRRLHHHEVSELHLLAMLVRHQPWLARTIDPLRLATIQRFVADLYRYGTYDTSVNEEHRSPDFSEGLQAVLHEAQQRSRDRQLDTLDLTVSIFTVATPGTDLLLAEKSLTAGMLLMTLEPIAHSRSRK